MVRIHFPPAKSHERTIRMCQPDELLRIRQRFQSPDRRQCGIYTYIRQRLHRTTRAVAELGIELGTRKLLLSRPDGIAGPTVTQRPSDL